MVDQSNLQRIRADLQRCTTTSVGAAVRLQEVQSHRADVASIDRFFFAELAEKTPGLTSVPKGIACVASQELPIPVGMAVAKGQPAFVQWLRAVDGSIKLRLAAEQARVERQAGDQRQSARTFEQEAGGLRQGRFPPIGRRELFRRTLPPADPVIASVRGAQLHFAPGQPAGLHRSTVTTVGVVLSGSIRFRPEGEEERVLHVGDQFIEGAGQTIVEFDNASDQEPAEIACFYLADTVDHTPAEFLAGGLDAQLGRSGSGAATQGRQ